MSQNEPFYLGNEASPEINSKDLYPVNRNPNPNIPYEILIEVDKDIFFRRFKSVSAFYRTLSNSNQGIGIHSPVKNYTNRKWWKYHFNGGIYHHYTCTEKLFILFELDMNPDSHVPSDLQTKMRIIKSFKGYKPIITTGIENLSIIKLAYLYNNCEGDSQRIGNRYDDYDELPF